MKHNVRRIYIHGIFTQMLFLLPVVVPYYNSIGLTFRDFLLGEAFFSAVVLLCEVPSGWISDVWKRRSTLVLGSFFGIIGLALLMLAQGFWSATIAQGIIGIAVALNSGTNTALLYDTLYEEGAQDDYMKLDGRRHGFGIYGTALSCFAGALLFAVHPKLPLLCDVWVLIVAMLAIAGSREPTRHTKSVERNMLHDMVQTMKYTASGHPEITGIIMVATVCLCTTKLMLWSQQPYYTLVGIPVEWFGAIMAGMYLLGGIAAQSAHHMFRWGSNRAAMGTAVFILVAACLLPIAFHNAALAIICFFMGTLYYGLCPPRINAAINARVGGERRATILSTASLMVHLLFIPTSAIIGYLSEHGGITRSMLWTGLQLLILGSIGLILWGRKTARSPALS